MTMIFDVQDFVTYRYHTDGEVVRCFSKHHNLTTLYLTVAVICDTHVYPSTVALLGLVSPGAATDGVTLFFSHRLWKVVIFFRCRLLTTPSSHVVYPVLFLNSARK